MIARTAAPIAMAARPSPRRGWEHGDVDAAELRRWCLGQRGAVEDFPFGPEHSVFKVGGKIFAISALQRTTLEVSVKSEPELALQLRADYAAIRPGYHLNKRHWNTVTLDGSLADELVRDL